MNLDALSEDDFKRFKNLRREDLTRLQELMGKGFDECTPNERYEAQWLIRKIDNERNLLAYDLAGALKKTWGGRMLLWLMEKGLI